MKEAREPLWPQLNDTNKLYKLTRVTDKSLSVSEGDIGRGGAVTLLVRNDLHTVVLPDADAGVGGTEIDTDRLAGNLTLGHFCR
jgi:NAD-specific glutamate dehydrogenase